MTIAARLRRAGRLARHRAAVGGQHTRETFEERSLPGAVRADQSEHLAFADLESDVVERDDRTESLGKASDLEQHRLRE